MDLTIKVALIGVVSALLTVLCKDYIVEGYINRRSMQKLFVQQQMELVYAPLHYLLYMYLQNENEQVKVSAKQSIMTIIQEKNYLIAPHTLEALYIILHDINQGADLLNTYFFSEYNRLKDLYRILHSIPPYKF